MKHSNKVLIAFAFCLTMIMAASIDAYAAKTYVGALYPTSGSNWNDYLVNDGLDDFTASDTACTGDETGGYSACLHGGEMRAVEVRKINTCLGLTATDALDAFNWACDESTAPVRMVSTGLKDGKNLSDLLDFTTPGWKPNSVTVYDGGIEELTSEITTWWTSPVVIDNDGGTLDDAGTIYVVTNDALTPATGGYIINASSVGLVGQPGVIINGSANGGSVISANASTTAKDFLWIEGIVDAAGDNNGVYWYSVRFSVLRELTVNSATYDGLQFNNSNNNSLTGITASNNGYYGIIVGGSNNMLSGVTASNNSSGVWLNYASGNTLIDVTSSDNGQHGVASTYSSYNTLTNVTVSNNGRVGIVLSIDSSNNMLSGITASNNGEGGIHIKNNSNYNTLSEVTASNNALAGLHLITSSYNTLTDITASNTSLKYGHSYGIYLVGSSYNTLSDIRVSDNDVGVKFYNYSSNNTLYKVTALSNGFGIVIITSCLDNTLSGITASNNNNGGILVEGNSTNNTLSGITASNNGTAGVRLWFTSSTSLSGVTASNNSTYGFYLRNSSYNILSGITASNHVHNSYPRGFYLYASSYNYFTGPLKVGHNSYFDCTVTGGGTDPGLVSGTCANQGASDALLTTGVTVEDSFVAKVTTDDTVNTSDINGAALYLDITDWTGFENSFRGWGNEGLTFLDPSTLGGCTTGTCSIWDWSAAAGDTVIKDSLAFPTGNDTLVHTWSDLSETTFLRNAVEIMDDGLGNENTLCESDEECLYMPNMGSYQGHGNLVSAGPFTDGTITGVTMLMYEYNGR